jgi:hypothetical protein
VLPKIDTNLFGSTLKDLKVDYSKLPLNQIGTTYITDILVGGSYAGRYVVDTKRNIIEVVFDFGSTSVLTIDDVFGLPNASGVRKYADFDIKYYPYDQFVPNLEYSNTVNIPFSKNTIPRLRFVTFK